MKHTFSDSALKNYGAFEMKEFIGVSTLRSFALTMAFLVVVALVLFLVRTSLTPQNVIPNIGVIVVLPQSKITGLGSNEIVRTRSEMKNVSQKGSNFIPLKVVPEKSIIEVENTNIFEVHTTTTHEIQNVQPVIHTKTPLEELNVNTNGEDEVFYDVEPVLNYTQLRENLHYPEFARKNGIEGNVLVKVVVGTDGKVIESKIKIIESTNSIFNQAAIYALVHSTFTLGLQNKQALEVSVLVPITFRLH